MSELQGLRPSKKLYDFIELMKRVAEEEKIKRQQSFRIAVENAKKVLQKGDRLRVFKCPGTKRWITFDHWDGAWIVSKSGIDDYAASCVDRVNDSMVNFCEPNEKVTL
ncbi:MAG: hypothetical protein QM496_13855 [Verrucomicrobiota bacterium]